MCLRTTGTDLTLQSELYNLLSYLASPIPLGDFCASLIYPDWVFKIIPCQCFPLHISVIWYQKVVHEMELLKYVHRNSLNHKNNSVQNVPGCRKEDPTQTLSDFWNQKGIECWR